MHSLVFLIIYSLAYPPTILYTEYTLFFTLENWASNKKLQSFYYVVDECFSIISFYKKSVRQAWLGNNPLKYLPYYWSPLKDNDFVIENCKIYNFSISPILCPVVLKTVPVRPGNIFYECNPSVFLYELRLRYIYNDIFTSRIQRHVTKQHKCTLLRSNKSKKDKNSQWGKNVSIQ